MKTILLWVVITTNSATSGSAEFDSVAACEAAFETMRQLALTAAESAGQKATISTACALK